MHRSGCNLAGRPNHAFVRKMPLQMRKSVTLLRELKTSTWLPQYNDRVIKEVAEEIMRDTREMKALVQDHEDLEEVPAEVASGLCLFNELMERNRRCLLAYLSFRLDRIEELRFEVGRMVPAEKLEKLHDYEKHYLHIYNTILDKYMKRYVPNCKELLDLTADAEAPEDMNVQVRVKAGDIGDIVTTDSGVLRLKKGYVHYVKRTDVEHLIRAGKVIHVMTSRVDDVGGG